MGLRLCLTQSSVLQVSDFGEHRFYLAAANQDEKMFWMHTIAGR
jgi:hypothetical protein